MEKEDGSDKSELPDPSDSSDKEQKEMQRLKAHISKLTGLESPKRKDSSI